jgi:ATP-dependent Clp protease adaptor protein ClpS
MQMSQSDTTTKIEINHDIKEPPMFRVIYLNDDLTSVEFVIESLISVFGYNADAAIQIAETIHSNGSAVVAVLPYEIAEQKGVEVTVSARSQNYPLQLKLEPEMV